MRSDTKIGGKRRGRPRAYDPDAALAQAADSFWSSGYGGTSLDELSEATGMNRPSLYAAFGNKQAIYIRAMDKFGQHMAAQIERSLTGPLPLEASLRAFYGAVLNVYFSSKDGARGCMVICTATTEAHTDPVIREYLDKTLQRIDEALIGRFKRAIAQGELPKTADASTLGRIAAASMHSIALRSRAGQSRASLKRMTDATAKLLAA